MHFQWMKMASGVLGLVVLPHVAVVARSDPAPVGSPVPPQKRKIATSIPVPVSRNYHVAFIE